MFGDPVTLSLASTDDSVLAKINQDSFGATYRKADAVHEVKLTIRHSKTKATSERPSQDRHNIELLETVFATSTVPEFTRKAYLVLEGKPSDIYLGNALQALAVYMLASSSAAIAKLRNWES